MAFYTDILAKNLDGTALFIARMVNHTGDFQIEELYVVDTKNKQPFVRKGMLSDKKSSYSLVTGGEVVNSFLTLYEVGYFFSSLFLAGVGTAVLNKKFLSKYRSLKKKVLLDVIKADLQRLTEKEIFLGMQRPMIAIISGMDTDVIPLRYNKHQLWKFDKSVLTKRVAEITPEYYGKRSAQAVTKNYWTKKDQEIADTAMKSTSSIQQAKALQYYLVLQILLKDLNIDINNIPMYFNFLPKEEIISHGPGNSLLKVLIGLHTPEGRIKYRKITGIDSPWILTKACPRCKQGDKRILSSKLMSDGITVKVTCKPHAYSFQNEYGDKLNVRGCGYKFSFSVPTDPVALYHFLIQEDFSIHFATRELLSVLRDSNVTPIGFVATELGIVRSTNNELVRDPYQVKGYGDNLDMLISTLGLQYFFAIGMIIGDVTKKLKKRGLVMPTPVMLFAYDKPTELVDSEITVVNKVGKKTKVSDTSALKSYEKGVSATEMLKRAICIHAFSLNELYKLRGKTLDSVGSKIQAKRSDNQEFISGRVDHIKSNNFLEFV